MVTFAPPITELNGMPVREYRVRARVPNRGVCETTTIALDVTSAAEIVQDALWVDEHDDGNDLPDRHHIEILDVVDIGPGEL